MANIARNRFIHRELSWLEFNARVLSEAMEQSNPLLERLKFIGIVSSNFDEFFMVRVASLKNTDDPTLPRVRRKAYELIEKENQYFQNVMVPELKKVGIERVPLQKLNKKQKSFLKKTFLKKIFPLLRPIVLSEDKQIHVLANLSLYSLISFVKKGKKEFAVIQMPKKSPRIIFLPAEGGNPFVLIEDVISLFIQELFLGCKIIKHGLIRLTRDAELALNEEKNENFPEVVTEALRMRRQGEVTRLEVSKSNKALKSLKKFFKVTDDEICPIHSWFDLSSISQLAYQPKFQELKRPRWEPTFLSHFEETKDIWALLKQKDFHLHHPYDSFGPVVRFVNDAADDPHVLEIKQTLYRTEQNSAIVAALERAAINGKRVTVLIELNARFNEKKNINLARRLELAGVSILYGVDQLKTHAKACLVIRKEAKGIRRYTHLSTGNYHEKTARLYSDLGFLTSNEAIANDVAAFFNLITGHSDPVQFSKIDVAPYGLKSKLLQLIHREAILSKKKPGRFIVAKMNSLVDSEIIEALYKASNAGVQIRLNIRGTCCLRPGVKGLSENIQVISIVDMFLEHSRIFHFANNGLDEIYLSSADWMPRNLERRIEIMFPIEDKEIKVELIELLKLYFKDNTKSWKLKPNGKYEKLKLGKNLKFRVQSFLCQKASDREKLH